MGNSSPRKGGVLGVELHHTRNRANLVHAREDAKSLGVDFYATWGCMILHIAIPSGIVAVRRRIELNASKPICALGRGRRLRGRGSQN